ncbi:odorant receptor 4-like [Polistes fuscatus]|uniref:odorant receptor 4-like n=1 Tax=Polistes fuscatus TaxID=30207 RepID=UPI001CA8C3AA|nr:odorant receptor 4-like [Polistes fuscatus]
MTGLNPSDILPNPNDYLNKYYKQDYNYSIELILCSTYTFVDLHDFKSRIKMTGSISFFIMGFIKYSSLLIRKTYTKSGIDRIKMDWMNVRYTEDRQIMLDYATFGRRLVTISAVFMFCGSSMYRFIVPIATKIVADNITYRRLVYPIPSIMFDARQSPINELMIVIQGSLGMVVNTITVGACGIAAVFVMHICGQLEVLVTWLKYLIDGRVDQNDNTKERLAEIVKKHVQLLSFISLTENLLNEISIVEVFGCTLNLCLLGYYCLLDGIGDLVRTVAMFTLLISFGFNIFIFCYIGELLTEQCRKVGEASYMINWYRLPGKEGLALKLIISMAASTRKFSAGKFVELSLSSFGDVIKTSVTYLNMLRTVTSRMS